MFEQWRNPPAIEIYRRVSRSVIIKTQTVFADPAGAHQMSLTPVLPRQHGLVIEPLQPGHQFAWVRTHTGDWLALVIAEVTTADRMNRLTMQFWLQPHQLMLPHKDFSPEQ